MASRVVAQRMQNRSRPARTSAAPRGPVFRFKKELRPFVDETVEAAAGRLD